jgi:hypothetical protein
MRPWRDIFVAASRPSHRADRYSACGLIPSTGRCWLQSMDRSLHPPLLQNPACAFSRTRLLSHVPVVIRTLPVVRTTGWACDLGCGASPSWGIAPSRSRVGLALLQPSSLRSRTPDRPHVSISEAFPSALAAGGIRSDTPSGWPLLPSPERTCRLPPFPVPMARIRRAVFSTGCLWQCRPVSAYGCRRPLRCPCGSSVSASCAGEKCRWLLHPFAGAAQRCWRDGRPGLRLPGSAVSPRFRPLRTNRQPGGYAVTPARGGRDVHPHGALSDAVRMHLAVCPEVHSSFRPTDRTYASLP